MVNATIYGTIFCANRLLCTPKNGNFTDIKMRNIQSLHLFRRSFTSYVQQAIKLFDMPKKFPVSIISFLFPFPPPQYFWTVISSSNV